MSRSFRFGSAISLVAMAAMIAGCAASQERVASHFGGKTDDDLGLATRALAALTSKDVPAATNLAERAVARTPNDAGIRGLLGNAYFAGGRFWSAESAYKDSLTIYPNQPQVVLKLALVEIALGKKDQAVAYLDAGRSALDPADYGLALALAGHSTDAVAVLLAACRQPGADARVRQNLALAYAFAGDWVQARNVAAQDVPSDQIDARIQQWMQLTSPKPASQQVAALVGVTPAATDQGQPVRLALVQPEQRLATASPPPVVARAPVAAAAAPVAAAPVRVAVAAPVAAPAPVPVAAQPQVAQTAPVPQFVEASVPAAPVLAEAPPAPPLPVETEAASPAPVTAALIAAASHVRSAFLSMLPHKPAPAAKPRPRVAKAQPMRGTSGAVVQLGAYGSPQRVSAAWNTLTDRYPALRAYLPMRAQFVSSKGTFWRLSISGFASQHEAQVRCEQLHNRGGKCFVRNFAGDAPVQYASR